MPKTPSDDERGAEIKPEMKTTVEVAQEGEAPKADRDNFEERLMRVFSGPMCLECLNETEDRLSETEETGDGQGRL